MYVPGKLKEDRSITFLLPALVTLALFFVALASGGPPLGWLVLGLAFAFFALLAARSYGRTRNPAILVQTAYLGLAAAWLLTSPRRLIGVDDPRPHRFLRVCLILSPSASRWPASSPASSGSSRRARPGGSSSAWTPSP